VLDASAFTNANALAQVSDRLSFILPAGYSGSTVPVTLSLTVNSYSLLGDAVINDSLTFGNGQSGCVALGNQTCAPGTIQGLNLSVTQNLSLSNLTNLFFQANISPAGGDLFGTGTATTDPGLSLTVPTGVTFTSQSGVFLTQAASVPGPILGAGLPGLVFASGGFLIWLRQRSTGLGRLWNK
jgi:hypothetical protein